MEKTLLQSVLRATSPVHLSSGVPLRTVLSVQQKRKPGKDGPGTSTVDRAWEAGAESPI